MPSVSTLLQVGAQFLALHYPLKLIYIPSPTWANHNKIFPLAGIQIRNYRYYKPSTRGLEYEVGALNFLRFLLNPKPYVSTILLALDNPIASHCMQHVCSPSQSSHAAMAASSVSKHHMPGSCTLAVVLAFCLPHLLEATAGRALCIDHAVTQCFSCLQLCGAAQKAVCP